MVLLSSLDSDRRCPRHNNDDQYSRWSRKMKQMQHLFQQILLISWCAQQCHSQQVNLSPSLNHLEVELESNQTLEISLSGYPQNTGYVLVQAHAHLYNVTLSSDEALSPGQFTTGYHIGVVVTPPQQSIAYLKHDYNNVTVSILLIAMFYDTSAPIPGGCNMELPIKTAPFLPTLFDEDLLTIEYPLGSWPLNIEPATCDRAPLQYDVYEMYLDERDLSSRTAFDSIRLMSNYTAIERNGRKVEFSGRPPSKVKFANYPGTGRVVAVILRTLTASAAYTPTLSYGCFVDAASDAESCADVSSVGAKLLNAGLLFLGLFLLVLGHRFYKCQLFLLGFCMSAALFYVILQRLVSVGSTVAGTSATAVGALGGALWLALWSKLGSPMAPVLLAALLLGSLLASIVAYTPLGDLSILKDDLPFWLAFGTIALCAPLLLISFAQLTSTVVTAVLGAYLIVIPIDNYIGANLKFIVVNVFRRAISPDFQTAIVDPPFQTQDLVLVIVWGALSVAGITIQWWRERGRAPFPPPPPSAPSLSSLHYDHYESVSASSSSSAAPQLRRNWQDEPATRLWADASKKRSSDSVIASSTTEATETTPLLLSSHEQLRR